MRIVGKDHSKLKFLNMSTQDQKDELHQGNVATEEQIEFASGNKELEKKIVRKVDWKLLPPLSLLMMASFIDRVNIGNARLLGLERDLKMHGTQFNTSLLVFFIPYILLVSVNLASAGHLVPGQCILPFVL